MLPRNHRLPASIRLKHPTFIRGKNFTGKFSDNDLSYSRFGFIVKKAVDKRATTRNRIRRLFRSCIESLLVEVKPGYDMLFFLEKGIIDTQQAELLQEIRTILSEKRLLEEKP